MAADWIVAVLKTHSSMSPRQVPLDPGAYSGISTGLLVNLDGFSRRFSRPVLAIMGEVHMSGATAVQHPLQKQCATDGLGVQLSLYA